MKDFWKILNTNLGYVFVSGHPTIEFKGLINSMTSEYLHFVPSINDSIALGLSTGAFISGFKSCVLLTDGSFELVAYQYTKVNNTMNIPIIFISKGNKNYLGLKQFSIDNLDGLNSYVYDKNNSAIIVVD